MLLSWWQPENDKKPYASDAFADDDAPQVIEILFYFLSGHPNKRLHIINHPMQHTLSRWLVKCPEFGGREIL